VQAKTGLKKDRPQNEAPRLLALNHANNGRLGLRVTYRTGFVGLVGADPAASSKIDKAGAIEESGLRRVSDFLPAQRPITSVIRRRGGESRNFAGLSLCADQRVTGGRSPQADRLEAKLSRRRLRLASLRAPEVLDFDGPSA
jgi:hypothetical protein